MYVITGSINKHLDTTNLQTNIIYFRTKDTLQFQKDKYPRPGYLANKIKAQIFLDTTIRKLIWEKLEEVNISSDSVLSTRFGQSSWLQACMTIWFHYTVLNLTKNFVLPTTIIPDVCMDTNVWTRWVRKRKLRSLLQNDSGHSHLFLISRSKIELYEYSISSNSFHQYLIYNR